MAEGRSQTVAFRSVDRCQAMIVLVNPRATRPANRRFPLSVMAIGAAIPASENWEIVDGNRPDIDPLTCISDHVTARSGSTDPVRAIAFTVMPGPQLANAVPLTKAVKARHPDIPIVWGGNFGSLYPEPVLHAPYVDWLIRGQGEHTFAELLNVLEGTRDPETVAGLSFRKADGTHHIGTERRWLGPGRTCPPRPITRSPWPNIFARPFWGGGPASTRPRSAVPMPAISAASFRCSAGREQVQEPSRTAEHLGLSARVRTAWIPCTSTTTISS